MAGSVKCWVDGLGRINCVLAAPNLGNYNEEICIKIHTDKDNASSA